MTLSRHSKIRLPYVVLVHALKHMMNSSPPWSKWIRRVSQERSERLSAALLNTVVSGTNVFILESATKQMSTINYRHDKLDLVTVSHMSTLAHRHHYTPATSSHEVEVFRPKLSRKPLLKLI